MTSTYPLFTIHCNHSHPYVHFPPLILFEHIAIYCNHLSFFVHKFHHCAIVVPSKPCHFPAIPFHLNYICVHNFSTLSACQNEQSTWFVWRKRQRQIITQNLKMQSYPDAAKAGMTRMLLKHCELLKFLNQPFEVPADPPRVDSMNSHRAHPQHNKC